MRKFLYPILILGFFSLIFWTLPTYQKSSDAFQRLTLSTRDLFFKIRRASTDRPSDIDSLLIVSIDEESCQNLGTRWPWSRKVFASMTEELTKHGARVIGFNISFTGLEDSGDSSSVDFAKAISRHGHVVIGATFDKNNRLVPPNPAIAEAAAKVGYLEKIVDPDYTIRRTYLLRPYRNEQKIPRPDFESSFPLQLLAVDGLPVKGSLPVYEADINLVTVGNPRRAVFVEKNGSYLINYLASETDFRSVPAWKVVESKVPDAWIRDKIVLVGLTSSLFADTHPTPLSRMSGIAIHANEFLAIRAQRVLTFLPDPAAYFISWLVALCIVAIFLARKFWLGLFCVFFGVMSLFIGAQFAFSKDLLIEPFLLMLGPFLALGVGLLTHSARLLWENRGLEIKVVHDKMTGLYTYDFLRTRLESEWNASRKTGSPVSLVMTDLDRFKRINDTLGHETGNRMILKAAEVIRDSVRGYDVVARYGGDEFVILLWRTGRKDAEDYRTRLRDLYHRMAAKLEPALQGSSISIGLATYDPASGPPFPESPQKLIEEADKDLFADKEKRKKPAA